MIVGG
ncbi:rCG53191, partial [Rattus norvegicus]